MRIGEPVDAGRYGILDHDPDGRPLCHVCGQPSDQLATHARQAHEIRTASDYRTRYGLAATTRLVSTIASDRMRAAWERHASDHLERLDATRDAAAANRASRAGQPWSAETRAKRQRLARDRRGPDLAPAQLARLCDGLDLQAWADAARTLQSDDGVTLAQLARASDITSATAGQRLRRYPPRT